MGVAGNRGAEFNGRQRHRADAKEREEAASLHAAFSDSVDVTRMINAPQ